MIFPDLPAEGEMKRFFIWLLALFLVLPAFPAGAETAPEDAFRSPGSVVKLGHFEQDNDPGNGPEAIEWMILDTREGKSLLVSRYALDARAYHEVYTEITWEACSLRAWLNGDFFSAAFSSEEQAAVLLSETDNSAAQGCGRFRTAGGNNTRDRIFLLSYAETERYFGSDRARRCAPTAYALARGAYTSYSREENCLTGLWWLRSPGNFQYRASVVYSGGSLNVTYVSKASGCVRPALWLDPELLPAK